MRNPCREALRSGVAVLALLAACGALFWLASGAQAQSGGNAGQQGGSGGNCLVVFGCEPSRPYLPGNNSPGVTPIGNPLQPSCIQSTSVAIASTCPSPSASPNGFGTGATSPGFQQPSQNSSPSGGNGSSSGSSSSGGSSSGSSSPRGSSQPTPSPSPSPSPSAAPPPGSASGNGASGGPPVPCSNCSDSEWATEQAASWAYFATGLAMFYPSDGSAPVAATSDQIAAAQSQLQQCLTQDMAGAPQSSDPQALRQQVYLGCSGELSVKIPS